MDDLPDNVVDLTAKEATFHPLAQYIDAISDMVEAPEFIIDDVLIAGTSVIAGERGLGKTSALVPLMIAATGLLHNYPLQASIRRKVVYIAEDANQVRRIVAAMRSGGMITADRDEFNAWFKLVEAARMPASEIVKVVPQYSDLYTGNPCEDLTTYLAPPVVVLDTTNATIDLENISDNSKVSDAVAMLRQNFGAICLVMIGHVSKASRGDAKQLSFIGAGAWEGDTQQTLYLVADGDERFLVLSKKRFESDVVEYRIASHMCEFEAFDKLKRQVVIKCFYGIPEASSAEVKSAAKAEQQAKLKAATWATMQNRVFDYVSKNPKATTRNISETVVGKAADIRSALAELIEKEFITTMQVKNSVQHTAVTGTQRDTVHEY